jgi:hypothetical protein
VNVQVSGGLENVIARCMSERAADRYPTPPNWQMACGVT